jgi:hypothetical protein
MSYRYRGNHMFWIKALFMLVATIVCAIIAAIPEGAMYFLWHIVAPTEGWQRLAMVALFILGGGGITILFWVLAGALWMAVAAACLDS